MTSPRLIFPLLISVSLLFITHASWACLGDAPFVTEEDLKSPPANMIALTAVITSVHSKGDMHLGKPHGGFHLTLKVTKVYQGSNLGESLTVSYGGCHNLPGKQGSEVNVLALPSKDRGWYAPQFWSRSKKP
jgi:hypothetical protein